MLLNVSAMSGELWWAWSKRDSFSQCRVDRRVRPFLISPSPHPMTTGPQQFHLQETALLWADSALRMPGLSVLCFDGGAQGQLWLSWVERATSCLVFSGRADPWPGCFVPCQRGLWFLCFSTQQTFSFLLFISSNPWPLIWFLLVQHSSIYSPQNESISASRCWKSESNLGPTEFSLRTHPLCPEQQVSLLQQKSLLLPGPDQPRDIFTRKRKGPTWDSNLAKEIPKWMWNLIKGCKLSGCL